MSRGHYALPLVQAHRREAHRLCAVLSHVSAAQFYGWPVKVPPSQPWVTVRRKRHLTAAQRHGVHVTWRDLLAEDVVDGVTSPLRTVMDCAMRLPFDEALAVADSALRSGMVPHHELVDAAGAARGLGAPQARAVASAADGRAANPFESVLRAICRDVPGVHVQPQVQVTGDVMLHWVRWALTAWLANRAGLVVPAPPDRQALAG